MSDEVAPDYAELAKLTDEAAAGTHRMHVIERALVGERPDDGAVQRLADAFRFPVEQGARPRQARFRPLARYEDEAVRSISVSEIDDATCEVWAGVAACSTDPLVRSHLHDLLFERRWGNVGGHARSAVEAYLVDADAIDPPSMRTVDDLSRAHDLAKLSGQPTLALQAISRTFRAASSSLGVPDPKPGIVLGLLRILVANSRGDDGELDDLLAEARMCFPDPWITEKTIGLQRKRAATPEDRQALDRDLVERWLEEADRAEPLVAVSHREKAAQVARERGLPDLADQAVRSMQAAGPPPMATLRVPHSSDVPREQIEEFIDSLVADTWWESVLRILALGPSAGKVEDNRRFAAELAVESPLVALLPVLRLGGDGLPRYSPTTEAEQADDQLTSVEVWNLRTIGQLHGEALRRASARHTPTIEDVELALKKTGTDSSLIATIGRVVRSFTAGSYESAVFVGLPLIERICRELLLSVDAPIYRVQRERSPGTYPGLGTLLPLLAERGLDQSWCRHLRAFLTAPNGFNYRNEVLHGFVDEVDATAAALVVLAILYLTLPQATPESNDGRSRPE